MLWETIAEENNCTMECNISSSSLNKSSSNRRVRRALTSNNLIMDAMDADVEEELSFYNDDDVLALPQERALSPELLGLLSPEGSPQRFQIVRQTKLQQQQAVTSTNATATTPAAATAAPTASRSFRIFNSLSSAGSMESSMDDDYMELFEMESFAGMHQQQQEQGQQHQQHNSNLPSGLNSLISGQIKVTPKSPTIMMRRPSVRRCLSMTETNSNQLAQQQLIQQQQLQQLQPKTPETARDCFKRPEPPASTSCSPIQSKRHRCIEKENCPLPQPLPLPLTHAPPLRKCISLNDAEIMSALARSENRNEPELIGDFSKTYALPLMEGRHRDLKSISSETVASLLNGAYDDEVASYRIIDCRYPYEYDGGHIRGAKNLYTHEQILQEFLGAAQTELQQQQQQNADACGKRNIIIFHCEFSSERGPKMSRFLRNLDRERNTTAYPSLHYPEIYLLHNGYKEFYETHLEHCQPEAYRPMLEPAYNEAYRHFRAKSKSWNGDGLGLGGGSAAAAGGGGGATGRLKKSRSRLML
ncbi:M-phase inducer phosphatase [Drosophila grimshawi]|uniref:protein-tyrosine-phosphatase n=1 Tax=Drosophila grimshawi TaxID=7222 RepID=B4JYJ6_DROGR|nr:M-phase inducer phosphatase [Drosophila grimshawi]EDV90758.1 GH14002 [Drosophila grimshawi]